MSSTDEPGWARLSPQSRQSNLQAAIERWEAALLALSMSVDASDTARWMTVPPNDPKALRASWSASILMLRSAVETANSTAKTLLSIVKAVQKPQ